MASLDLGKQVGPLPLGAWIAALAGGLGLAYYSYRTQKATTPTVVDNTGGQPGVGDGSVGGWTQTQPPPTDTSGGDNAPITTNEQWAVRAINWLIAQGYDAAESDSAIRKYLAGNDPAPSVKEYVLQGLALQHFGSPPQPLPPAVNPPPVVPPPPPQAPPPVVKPPPPPPPSTPPPPVQLRYYTVKPWPQKGSSLWTIAEIFYGNGADWPRIYNANKVGVTRPDGTAGWISNPDLIYAGRTVYVP